MMEGMEVRQMLVRGPPSLQNAQGGAHFQASPAPNYPIISILTNSERSLYFIPMMTETKTENCSKCGERAQRFGKHRNGLSRFRCVACKITFTEKHERLLGGYLPEAKVTLALQLLLEGNTIRSTERITGLDRNT